MTDQDWVQTGQWRETAIPTPPMAIAAARLERWAGSIETFGPDIEAWTRLRFLTRELREMAAQLRQMKDQTL